MGYVSDGDYLSVIVTVAAIRVLNVAGVCTAAALREQLPATGYSVEEVVNVMESLIKAGVVEVVGVDSPRIYRPGSTFPTKESC